MIERIKHILIIRDIYLGLLAMPKNEVLIPLEERRALKKRLTKRKEPSQGGIKASESTGSSSAG